MNSDEFLVHKRGFVFWPFPERKEIVESIKGVDEVIAAMDEDQTVRKTLEYLKPDIFAKGGSGLSKAAIPEAETCHKIGCKLVTNVGGGIVWLEDELTSRVRSLNIEHETGMKIMCPYCDDHPMLREKCLYCGGAGKIEVGKTP
ncbi:MAG: hypothetical protein PHE50_08050 [Dehalococcoidales bacterium]|nr:hypothetical protein [Dehalococcoidales bacterium]